MEGLKNGTVKWFSDEKGFGFIENPNIQGDIFVHYSDIQGDGFKSLEEGDRVEFEVEDTPKGIKALDVVKID